MQTATHRQHDPGVATNTLPQTRCRKHIAAAAQVLNGVTRKLPFFVSQTEETAEPPREELRLKHRVLDLR